MDTTAEVIRRFNDAFVERNAALLDGLIDEDCVMIGVQPAPEGTAYHGRAACAAFWTALIDDPGTRFTPQEVIVAGDRAVISWRAEFSTAPDPERVFGEGQADWVLGVNVMRVENGRITEALGYSKTP